MTQVDQLSTDDMLALLAWYQSVGVDVCVSETGINQFEAEQLKAAQPQAQTMPGASELSGAQNKNVPQQGQHTKPDALRGQPSAKAARPPISQMSIEGTNADPDLAEKLAKGAKNLTELRARLESLEGFSLRLRATQLVFGDGNEKARIMFVGKSPGRDEDISGVAFSGQGGELLDNMLRAIGLDRNNTYLSNIVPWRPPGSRDPAPQEIAMCLPFIKRQIELVAPDFLVCLGEIASRTLLGENISLLNSRGKWHELKLGGHSMQVITSLHPEFLLKQPAQKRQAWLDLQQIRRKMNNNE